MSILDDAIREHLELKRAHGADETELKRLEDEAFGPPGRPEDELDPFAEAPTQFLGEAATGLDEAPPETEGGRRMPNIADLQEPPPFPVADTAAEAPPAAAAAEAPAAQPAADEEPAPEASAPPEAEPPTAAEAPPEPPAEEQHPAMEHEAIPAPPAPAEPDSTEQPTPAAEAAPAPEIADAGPSTEEREAIAEQPTRFFDVEAELTAEGPDTSDRPTPTDEQLLDSQLNEPRLAPVEPLEPLEEEEEEPAAAEAPEPAASPTELELADEGPSEEYDEDDFFSEQRLSDELNQALEAPVTDEHEALPEHEPFREPEPLEPAAPPPAPRTEEATAIFDFEGDVEDEEESDEHDAYEPAGEHEDVLEETPEFLEGSPDDDDLWFEQRPPKDFDFDD